MNAQRFYFWRSPKVAIHGYNLVKHTVHSQSCPRHWSDWDLHGLDTTLSLKAIRMKRYGLFIFRVEMNGCDIGWNLKVSHVIEQQCFSTPQVLLLIQQLPQVEDISIIKRVIQTQH